MNYKEHTSPACLERNEKFYGIYCDKKCPLVRHIVTLTQLHDFLCTEIVMRVMHADKVPFRPYLMWE